MPNFKELEDTIVKLKKYNIAIRAITRNVDWDEKKITSLEKDFNINFDENDRNRYKRPKNTLINEFKQSKFHSKIIENLEHLFKFQEKIKNNKLNKVATKESAQFLNLSAESIALILKFFDISTSQIRRYLDSLRKIKASIMTPEDFNGANILLQQVKVAYAVGRDADLAFFYEVMKGALKEGSESFYHFEQLLRFVEAIVAYHKFYKGED